MDQHHQHRPPEKRRRTRSGDSSNEPTKLSRGDPWLEDGNIVLQADHTQFRVVKSLLMASSVVFRDMFTSASSDVHTEDGCPIIMVHDNPEELSHLLKAVYDHSYVPSFSPEPVP
jgi:hypothetical protein